MQQATFISRTAAYNAAEQSAREAGVPEGVLRSDCRVYGKYQRGELVGFNAFYPTQYGPAPVLEE